MMRRLRGKADKADRADRVNRAGKAIRCNTYSIGRFFQPIHNYQ